MTYCLIVDQDQHMMLSDRDSRLCGPMKGDPASTQTPLVPVHMGVPVSHMTHCPCCGDRLSKTRPSQLRALNGAESQQDQTMSEGEAHGGRTCSAGWLPAHRPVRDIFSLPCQDASHWSQDASESIGG
jgi:hypothetical protein